MVLAFNGQSVSCAQLLKLLKITPIGAPRRNIQNLAQLGINVTYREASLAILAET